MGSWAGWNEEDGLEWKLEKQLPALRSSILVCLWLKSFTLSIHPSMSSGCVVMERIMVVICWSRPVEKGVEEVKFILNLGLCSKVLKCSNIVLETIIGGSIFIFPQFLVQSGDVPSSLFLHIKGTEVFLQVSNDMVKVIVCCSNVGI